MRRWLALVFLIFVSMACRAQTPGALESEPSGWKDILPNAAFDGWTRLPFLTTNAMDPVSQWKVDTANRVLLCEGNRGHEWLRYDRELTDAIFHAEFRFTPIAGGKGYNSGVMIRNNADGTIWYQAQAGEEGTGYLFGANPVNGKPERFNLRSEMKENRVRPAGQWNVYELRAEGPRITVWVNGGVTTELAAAAARQGYAGLEAEGYRIEFRNLKLKELK